MPGFHFPTPKPENWRKHEMSLPLEDIDKPNILVVDDDRGTVELIQMMLQVRGYNVLVAYSGLEAIAMIQDKVKQHSFWHTLPIDLILLDIMMPGIDGFKVCQRVKDDPVLKYIPVIMVTALENTSDKVAAVEFGADGYITKPFLPEELGSAIKAKLQIKRREEELLRRNTELETVNAVMRAATSTLDPNRVLEASLTALMNHAPLAAAAVYLYDETSDQLKRIIQQRIKRPEILTMKKGIVSDVFRTQQTCIQNDISLSKDWQGQAQDVQLGAWMGIPLRGVERSLGVLEIYDPHPYVFEKYELDMFTTIGYHIGSALENAQLFQHAQTLLTKSYKVGTTQT
jgi:DNA-binding response OmpR family regulator